jgi:hypothetical protein
MHHLAALGVAVGLCLIAGAVILYCTYLDEREEREQMEEFTRKLKEGSDE